MRTASDIVLLAVPKGEFAGGRRFRGPTGGT
jgi:hypothetical protein